MGIEHRGEIELTVGGETYVLAPHHAFISKVEARFGTLGDLLEKMQADKIKVSDIAAAFRFALPADQKMAERESIEIVVSAGTLLVRGKIAKVIEHVTYAGRTLEEILEEVRGKKEPSGD